MRTHVLYPLGFFALANCGWVAYLVIERYRQQRRAERLRPTRVDLTQRGAA